MAAGRRLALVMLGDCMLGRIVDESLTAAPAQRQRLWGDVLPLLRGGMAAPGEAQLNLANLETAVTEAEEPDDTRIFNFRMSPANVPALTCAPPGLGCGRLGYASHGAAGQHPRPALTPASCD